MLMRTDPFRELDRVAQQVFGTAARPAAMPIDAYRKGDEFVVLFDLPGCDPASINLTVERNVLAVHAERSRPSDDDIELLIGERPTGTFSRQLFLADTLDSEHIEADYTDGVLRLRVPVKEQAKPRRVDIAVGNGQPDIDRGLLTRRVATSLSAPACRDPPGRGGAVEHAAGSIEPSASPTTPPRSSPSARPQRCWTCNPPSSVASTPKASSARPAQRGGQRRYSRVELDHIAALAALMSEGMTLAGAQRIIELENEVAELRRQLAAETSTGARTRRLTVDPAPAPHTVIDTPLSVQEPP